jgi:hypothetical protein
MRTIVLLALILSGALSSLRAQRGIPAQLQIIETITIDVPEDPYPLARIAEQFEHKFGVPVSYEDAPWTSPADTINSNEHPANRDLAQKNPGWKGPKAPRGGSLSIQLQMDKRTNKPIESPGIAIQSAIAAHRSRNNPGDFAVIALGEEGFSIVPTNMRNASGSTTATQSPFDSRISFPEADRNADETLHLILDGAAKASGHQVIFGGLEFYPSYHVRLGAKDEIARNLLAKLFRDLAPIDSRDKSGTPRFSWRLLYAPEPGFYGMNIHIVEQELLAPGGGVIRRPVWKPTPATEASK